VNEDDPVLRRVAVEIDDIDKEIVSFALGMRVFVEKHRAAGLAASQVGFDVRMFCFRLPNGLLNTVLNPEIVEMTGSDVDLEGCLSIPGRQFKVERPTLVSLTGVDLSGNAWSITAEGFTARLLLHELDHLNGKLISRFGEYV
jgi:peptide deformylase